MISENDILYNTFSCMNFSEETQKAINDIVIYSINAYIDYYKGKSLEDLKREIDAEKNVAKSFYIYTLDLMLSGVFPETFCILTQNYYESTMQLIETQENIKTIRIQMLYVLYSSRLLHENNVNRFLEVANQFVSNKLFDVDYYKRIFDGIRS